MDDYTVPGWRVWQTRMPTPVDLLKEHDKPAEPVVEAVATSPVDLGPIMKPLVADVVIEEDPNPAVAPKVVPETKRASNEIVIALRWEFVVYAVVALLFLYMLYQFSYMHSRILVLEATLAAGKVRKLA